MAGRSELREISAGLAKLDKMCTLKLAMSSSLEATDKQQAAGWSKQIGRQDLEPLQDTQITAQDPNGSGTQLGKTSRSITVQSKAQPALCSGTMS